MKPKYIRPLVFFFIIGGALCFYFFGGKEYLSLDFVKSNFHTILNLYEKEPFKVVSIFMAAYVLITSLSIPGAIVLTLLSGALFGVALGTALVAISSCIGACISFLMVRFLFKDYVMKKYAKQYRIINNKMKRQGQSYLFTLRLLPASPFVVINLVMGLTSIDLWSYCWITLLGMLPGTIIYVYAGRKFAELDSISGIMSPPIIISLLLLSFLPYIWKFILKHYHQKRISWN